MPRPRNPLSKRNRSATFTGEEVARAVERLAASKKARVVRERREFDLEDLASIVRAPFQNAAAYSWSIEQIVAAREQQLAGRFRLPARLAESFGTDDALFTARQVRLAPVQGLDVQLAAGRGPKGDKIADEADALFGAKGIAITSDTISTIRKHLVDHGVAFAAITWTPRPDGSRLDPVLNAWPIEFVWWHEVARCYVTQVRRLDADPDPVAGQLVAPLGSTHPLEPIVHGNGRWIIFQKEEVLPHRGDAALLSAALVWARHAFALRDWAKGSAAHGNPKVIGELPAETALTDEAGDLTAEAAAFLQLVQAVASQDQPVGIKPAGSKLEYLTNTSGAWEVWVKLAEVAERAAARIYLGTDGVLGAQGGAPGVDISELLGVASGKIQSDLEAVERGLQSGLVNVWAALNFGDDKSAPTRSYVFPDPDLARVREDFAKRNAAFLADLQAYRAAGCVLTQEFVDRIAEQHGVPSPQLLAQPAAPGASDPVAPAPTAE